MSEIIRTERLVLRAVQLSDAQAMVAAVGDIEVSRWLTHVPHPYGADDAETFITKARTDFPNYAAIQFNGEFAGMISANEGLGYWIGKPFWGQGLVIEAAQAMISHQFEVSEASQLRSGYILGNNRSRRILEILGFANDRIEKATPYSTGVEVDVQKMTLTRARYEATV
jgi:RimJ/RimL family protein N-acetyltransferase